VEAALLRYPVVAGGVYEEYQLKLKEFAAKTAERGRGN